MEMSNTFGIVRQAGSFCFHFFSLFHQHLPGAGVSYDIFFSWRTNSSEKWVEKFMKCDSS